MDAVTRFLSRVAKSDGCWLWQGANTRGYGYLNVNGRRTPAHRFSYELHVGPIAPGLEIDHLCRAPSCVRPDHLEPVPHRMNVLRGVAPSARHAKKTACPRGHEYDAIDNRGARYCSTCNADRIRAKLRRVKTAGSPCSRGHALDRQNKRGAWFCSTCVAERNRANGSRKHNLVGCL